MYTETRGGVLWKAWGDINLLSWKFEDFDGHYPTYRAILRVLLKMNGDLF